MNTLPGESHCTLRHFKGVRGLNLGVGMEDDILCLGIVTAPDPWAGVFPQFAWEEAKKGDNMEYHLTWF